MSSTSITPSAGRALTPGAVALMLMLCLSWGFNQVAVKLVLPDVPQADVDASVLLGDLLIVAGAALWATTTLIIKATALIRAPAEKGLGYQVAISIPIFVFAAWFSGERITHIPSPLSLSLLAYQSFWVVGLTFTLWF